MNGPVVLSMIVVAALLPIGSLGAGTLAELIGLRTTRAVGSAGLPLSSLWLVLSPIRTMRDFPARERFSTWKESSQQHVAKYR